MDDPRAGEPSAEDARPSSDAPSGREARPAGDALGSQADRLGDLRGHVDAAYEAADRLVREATERAEGTAHGAVPPRGWDVPQATASRDPWGIPELRTLLGIMEALRSAIPPDLLHQLIVALRDLLAAIRALIDWWVDRLERHAQAPPAPVEDIPIE